MRSAAKRAFSALLFLALLLASVNGVDAAPAPGEGAACLRRSLTLAPGETALLERDT